MRNQIGFSKAQEEILEKSHELISTCVRLKKIESPEIAHYEQELRNLRNQIDKIVVYGCNHWIGWRNVIERFSKIIIGKYTIVVCTWSTSTKDVRGDIPCERDYEFRSFDCLYEAFEYAAEYTDWFSVVGTLCGSFSYKY